MLKTRTFRKPLLTTAMLAVVLGSMPPPARAASKEIIELQTQVQQLLDQVQRLQSTVDTRFGVLQHLIEQSTDNANQMTATINALQQKISAQSEAGSGKMDTVSGQVQSLNDSVDELKSRITKLDSSIQALQGQLQNIQSQPAGAPPAAQPASQSSGPNTPPQAAPGAMMPAPAAPPAAVNQAPPLAQIFQAAANDYNAGRYDVAGGEFQDVVHYYPLDDLAGQAQFYLGEIAYRKLDYTEAIKDFNAVLESFPGSSKAPAAQLRKGTALLQTNKREAGIHELRLLIQRHPQTPEAAQARSKLNAMGVHITASASR